MNTVTPVTPSPHFMIYRDLYITNQHDGITRRLIVVDCDEKSPERNHWQDHVENAVVDDTGDSLLMTSAFSSGRWNHTKKRLSEEAGWSTIRTIITDRRSASFRSESWYE